jgi:hypothetical protein
VPERGEKVGRGMERRHFLTVPKSAGDTCRVAETRREITPRPVNDVEEKQREKREASVGFL